MGYRSEVAYIVNFRNKEIRDEYIALIKAHGGELLEALMECEAPEPMSEDSDAPINFYADYVKWYEDFPDVKAHTKIYQWAVELYPDDCGYKFIRVGEESGDIEEEDDGSNDLIPYDDFYPTQSMSVPFSSHIYTPLGKVQEDATV